MADVNIERRSDEGGSSLERSQGERFRRRFPSLWRRPDDLNPFTMMRRFTDEMDRMFTDVSSGRETGGRESEGWAPVVEVREQDGRLVVSADLPGLSKDEVKVEVNEEGLVIQGERKREHKEERGGYVRSERSYGSFYRAIPLPEGASVDKAKAQFNNGVLEVSVPIPESQQRRRQIPVEAGEDRKPIGSQTTQQTTQTSKAG